MATRKGKAGDAARASALSRMQTARAKEEKRLGALAKKLKGAAAKIELAAVYWGDGAYGTARAILTGSRRDGKGRLTRSASSYALSVVKSLNTEAWFVDAEKGARANRSRYAETA